MSLLPDKMPVTYEIIPLTTLVSARVLGLANDGTVYAMDGMKVVKSIDWGSNWTDVYTSAAGQPQHALKTPSGNVVVLTVNGKVFRSDTAEANFTEVVLDPLYQGTPLGSLGPYQYDKYIMLPDYGAMSAYLSVDEGESFTRVFTSPDSRGGHVHAFAFDPYEGLLWACCGDAYWSTRIFWSCDLGKTWVTHKADLRYRMTSIMPLPDCILFGADQYNEMAVYKYDRIPTGAMSAPEKVELSLFHRTPYWEAGGPTIWATTPCITYGAKGRAYWGYYQHYNERHFPSAVWASDGAKIYPIWIDDHIPEIGGVFSVGIWGVYGPDKDNNIVAYLRDKRDGVDYHMVKISLGSGTT